ncbi:uncharacterized protein LOC124912938 [Impatiens glandulifera]|uniref:uncharacterized protein LOC124912938 n=1 Tax=Impatiens glandulifera TaxID=253017 RepID=UPI001FB160D6|nr:uncharacterized protein LOC124912938 [Impatiens glandulifera]
MGMYPEEEVSSQMDSKRSLFSSTPESPTTSRPSSMVIKKVHRVIPAHIVAEAISSLHGLDLRWSGPITPTEMQYVEQYVVAKYPEYSNVEKGDQRSGNLNDLCIKDEPSDIPPDFKGKSPRPTSSSSNCNLPDMDQTRLEPSRLLDILSKKSSFLGSFISIPEIQAQNRVLKHCGLPNEEYLVLFTQSYKDAMMLVGESYPFFKGNIYMSILSEEEDYIREFASYKESKVIHAPESWLDLRIKGSQLSQYFRRKCKHTPKGLFCYPIKGNESSYNSMHWISEAHRNSWHVLLDATNLVVGEDQLNIVLHRPDFVLCSLYNNSNTNNSGSSKITCLLVRRRSFDSTTTSLSGNK